MKVLIENNEIENTNVEVDYYVPINIKFGSWNNSLESSVYVRKGDLKSSLLEIGIGRNRGALRSITLVLCKKAFEEEKKEYRNIKTYIGIPKISTDIFENKSHINELCDIEAHIGYDNLTIVLSNNEITSIKKNKDVMFCLDIDGEIVEIIINNLSKNQIIICRESLLK